MTLMIQTVSQHILDRGFGQREEENATIIIKSGKEQREESYFYKN